eukprot:TRINITY_DN10052_c0_g1_i1.p1 TRINITY_DN10052_c0_g1~~TRINITY_DN10052_c0_g1_i1.p1  ORF type:complete len:215 (-),score=-14.02 TRINITY_DN10052_c0_g1_i1:421-1065(-)
MIMSSIQLCITCTIYVYYCIAPQILFLLGSFLLYGYHLHLSIEQDTSVGGILLPLPSRTNLLVNVVYSIILNQLQFLRMNDKFGGMSPCYKLKGGMFTEYLSKPTEFLHFLDMRRFIQEDTLQDFHVYLFVMNEALLKMQYILCMIWYVVYICFLVYVRIKKGLLNNQFHVSISDHSKATAINTHCCQSLAIIFNVIFIPYSLLISPYSNSYPL